MRINILILVLLTVLIMPVYGKEGSSEIKISKITPDEILQLVENRDIGDTSLGDMEMILKSGNADKRRRLKMFRNKKNNDNQNLFIHFLSPADIKNTTYLVIENDRKKKKWMYLSSFKKRRKIVSKDNNTSFVSSDFTYEDLETVHADEYKCSDLKEELAGKEEVYVFTARKIDQSTTAYSKLIFTVAKSNNIPLIVEMFSKNNEEHVKTLTAEKIKDVDGISTPFITKIVDLKNGSSTELKVKKIEYNLKLPQDTFTTRNMEK